MLVVWAMLWFESNDCQTYTITPPPKGTPGWELGSRVIKAPARERKTPGKGELLETTKVEIQTKEIQACLHGPYILV